MIVKMIRYDFVLYSGEHERFLERLQELGLVDVTVTGWEPSEADLRLIADAEAKTKAVEALRTKLSEEDFKAGEPYATGEEAFAAYAAATTEAAALRGEIARYAKSAEELLPWGEFSAATIAKMAEQGVVLRYFNCNTNAYNENEKAWSENYTLAKISEQSGQTYFVVVATPEAEIEIDAEEVKAPTMNYREAEALGAEKTAALAATDEVVARAAATIEKVEAEAAEAREKLHLAKVVASGEKVADDKLVVMEGWAEEETAEKVDAMLEEYPNMIYLKRKPTEEDETPVKLKNNRFARLFELIGGMYALPKYGTLDLTPFFGPFYMLFFAICLNDAGYGAILLAAGIALYLKGGEKMRMASLLTMVCGGATTLFGLYTGSLFGMSIPDMLGYESIEKSPFLDFQNDFFSIALAIGVLQIMFGMAINIVMKSRLFGFKSAMPLLGWFIVLLSGVLAAALPMLNEKWVIPFFTTSSVAFYVAVAIGLAFMLLFNGKNPIMSILSGLWDTYNNITGLLSDVLSYIRLFAIGLSGGVLAQVFNQLAFGLTGLDSGIEQFGVGTIFQILGAAAILLVGHGINLFMSAISSFVHPMRLTFVEFYKNAGFEMTSRNFEPLKKEVK